MSGLNAQSQIIATLQVQPGILQCRVPYQVTMTYFSHFVPHQRKILSGSYIQYRFMHDHQIWYGIFVQFIYVIYRQTFITVNTQLT